MTPFTSIVLPKNSGTHEVYFGFPSDEFEENNWPFLVKVLSVTTKNFVVLYVTVLPNCAIIFFYFGLFGSTILYNPANPA